MLQKVAWKSRRNIGFSQMLEKVLTILSPEMEILLLHVYKNEPFWSEKVVKKWINQW